VITIRVDEKALESVVGAAVRADNLTATERWNIACLANAGARACADKASAEEIEGVPIP
jgi:hypothetical protein